ncbi:hypothetical protein JQ557_04145 [Bradyrhizobium sp. U87765 SZCCT0131]|uniref:hypothetical protein n=1 Tax=unclassified Bradyrhizobium TaxID=2631580 RepID=UPI001BAC5CE9|nr:MULTISPECIES: hypothetical protein [unclassified Bradyrhizobium]MBR1217169.1 hypothetical protein [Bradyrhizobium sp. U87765 SZCCT0131]MBR1259075.1 hypothetical protein [Bradyrhizobium sp. U87765 SZCCT0134]MBR1305216.1 hypothetical protein [Bradyrhizobium sp. U87765 SZCCT0110]MBR1321002.1 hypothetical protein [Bradyrhizobium sp. U87765 SZCCT0109]MBR1350344.1 hypothetical protein [Bradyrhizobium sp. U87765 SZCCT0048]
MAASRLPPKPDFAALEAAAPRTADRRTLVLSLIGNLVANWSNNESLFIYVLMLLLGTDQASAALVFATLNTTRARLDLIQRLSRIKIKDKLLAKQLDQLIDRFNEGTQIRNELNHCMYVFDGLGEIVQTQSMRIIQTRRDLKFGETKAVDDVRIKEMTNAAHEMERINRDIWDFLPRLESHLR